MEQVPSNTFTGLGFESPIDGAELFDVLRVDSTKLVFPYQFDQMKKIADFVNQYPESISMIRQAMYKKPMDVESLQHAERFIGLHSKRMELKKQLDSLEDELSLFE